MKATIILLTIMCIGTGIELAKHGEHYERRYNFWLKLLADAILLTLYYYAGLFNNF
jgi:hypothetical protein